MSIIITLKSFEGHKGIPGVQGGSLPRGSAASDYGMVTSKRYTTELESKTKELITTVKVTSKEKKSLKNYKYGEIDRGYIAINSQLRGKTAPTVEVQTDIANIDSAMGTNILSEDFVVYRGVADDFPVREGIRFIDNGYISTSLAVNRPLNLSKGYGTLTGSTPQGSIFRIVVPKGSKGIWMDGIVKGMYEHELLLPRGGKFKIGKEITPSISNYLPFGRTEDATMPKIYEAIYEQG